MTTDATALSDTIRRIDDWTLTRSDGLVPARSVHGPQPVIELSWCDWDPALWEAQWNYATELHVHGAPGDRHFLRFDGMHSRIGVSVDGHDLGERDAGFLPVEYELGPVDGAVRIDARVDGRWLPIPPMGSPLGSADIDFHLPAGMHRPVWLLRTPNLRVAEVRVDSAIRDGHVAIDIDAELDWAEPVGPATVRADVIDGAGAVVVSTERELVPTGRSGRASVALVPDPVKLQLWDVDAPVLYDVVVSVRSATGSSHRCVKRTGFRTVEWERDGFRLNGVRHFLIGLNRHELFPYVGFAASDRSAREDARILKEDLGVSLVRTSHYPPTPAFLDACDELGLLVFEEVPGWQYAGTVLRDQTYPDSPWHPVPDEDIDPTFRAAHIDQVRRMILRDRHRPSVVLWGLFLNESRAFTPGLWDEVRRLAASLDSRPTSGATRFRIGGHQTSDFDSAIDDRGNLVWPFDVFGYNNYQWDEDDEQVFLPAPPYPYLIAEAVGQYPAFSTHFNSAVDGHTQHAQALHHAAAIDRAAAIDGAAGIVNWVAFDYQTSLGRLWGATSEQPQGHRVKAAGVGDVFRILKPGAAPYRALVAPEKRLVIAPAFLWDWHSTGQPDGPPTRAAIASNCDLLELRLDGKLIQTLVPSFDEYPHSMRPLFFADFSTIHRMHGRPDELQIDGYIGDEHRATVRLSADPSRDLFHFRADDEVIANDGIDTTRLQFGVVDAFGNPRAWRDGLVSFEVEPTARLIGDNPFDGRGTGSSGAVWLAAVQQTDRRPSSTRVVAKHPDHDACELVVMFTPQPD
ncbi:glycoside hydrolase family 2 TIM barrel-domain containing protein [Kribbella sp. CA-294648]|uniref:glycoside hydrolase family 2 protein n=1 Tax=Kribbella sp. CA-294648 TaxID=3239948 RepID=UPI003D8C6221